MMTSTDASLLLALLLVVASGFSRTAVAQTADLDPRIVKLVAGVSEERLGVDPEEARELRDAQHAVVDRQADTQASAPRASGFSTR